MVDAADLRSQDSLLPLESAARPVLQRWLDDTIKPRFAAFRQLCLGETDTTCRRDLYAEHTTWQHKLDYELDKALCLTRAGQLFDLVALYPNLQQRSKISA